MLVNKDRPSAGYLMESDHPLEPSWVYGLRKRPLLRQLLDNMHPAERRTFVLDFLDYLIDSGMLDPSKLADFKPPWT
jgi:hypothetical protein